MCFRKEKKRTLFVCVCGGERLARAKESHTVSLLSKICESNSKQQCNRNERGGELRSHILQVCSHLRLIKTFSSKMFVRERLALLL